jgi:transcription initiation factor TFIIH subunit 2|tara:strand:- start:256 stop:1584 length:1329 start_codon:yes stop_codon:yes gene_type:complete
MSHVGHPDDRIPFEPDDPEFEFTAEEQQNSLKAYEKAYQKERTWEDLTEDADGNLRSSALENDASRQRRFLANEKRRKIALSAAQSRVAKGMIRYCYVMIDLSDAIHVEDMRPNRSAVLLPLMIKFIREFFNQNPLSQLGLIACKDGKAERITELSGSPETHVKAIKKAFASDGIGGSFSLQNGLEQAMEGLRDVPPFGAREIIAIISSLSTCDPGNINESVRKVKKMKARTNVICVAAETRVFKKLTEETKGKFSVSLDQSHLMKLILECAPPPALLVETAKPALVEMGFPRREPRKFGVGAGEEDDRDVLTIGPKNGEYRCPRCEARVDELPSQCGTCQLSLVSSPHLARSYHHLFPVMPFVEVKIDDSDEETKKRKKSSDGKDDSLLLRECYGCCIVVDASTGMLSKCLKCEKEFCFACDVYIHDRLHNCVGCLTTAKT